MTTSDLIRPLLAVQAIVVPVRQHRGASRPCAAAFYLPTTDDSSHTQLRNSLRRFRSGENRGRDLTGRPVVSRSQLHREGEGHGWRRGVVVSGIRP